jgi:calcium/calmodulin-dependent protein kinase I
MYILITGKHPLFKHNDTMETYVARLKNIEWEFPKEFSELARGLFLRLVRVNPLERYTAKEAFAHPWITRIPGPIPLSYSETIQHENARKKLIDVLPTHSLGLLPLFLHLFKKKRKVLHGV